MLASLGRWLHPGKHTRRSQPDVILPLRQQSLRVHPAHELFPRAGLRLGRPSPERRQVQSLRNIVKPGRKLAVVDVSISVHVELVEQSLDLGVGDVQLPANHREVLVLDPPRFVHIASGKKSPKTGSVHGQQLKRI